MFDNEAVEQARTSFKAAGRLRSIIRAHPPDHALAEQRLQADPAEPCHRDQVATPAGVDRSALIAMHHELIANAEGDLSLAVARRIGVVTW